MGYIYKITNTTNNKCYIGQTNRSYKERWQEHKRDKNKEPYKDWPLYRMLNQVPEELVSWEVLEETDKGNNAVEITEALITEAIKGNVKAYEVIRDTLGQKPVEVQQIIETPVINDDI